MKTQMNTPTVTPHAAPVAGMVPLAPRGQLTRAEVITPEDIQKATSQSTKMALALAARGHHTYEGTVPRATVLKRRAANKRARVARRAHR